MSRLAGDMKGFVVTVKKQNKEKTLHLLSTPAAETGIANKAYGTSLPCSISSLHTVFKVLGDARFLSFVAKL